MIAMGADSVDRNYVYNSSPNVDSDGHHRIVFALERMFPELVNVL